MKVILIFFLTCLFLNLCLGKFSPLDGLEHIQKCRLEEESSLNKNGTKLIDLNIDCLHLIGDYLNLIDLLNLAQTNHELRIFATEKFRQRFSQYEIQILNEEARGRNRRPKPIYGNIDFSVQIHYLLENYRLQINQKDNDERVSISNGNVYIYDFDLALNVLKFFGSVIQKLTIKNYIESNKWEMFTKSINKYCAESLLKLDLGAVNENSLHQFTATFKNVNDFSAKIANNQNDIPKLNKLFPQLRRLSLEMNWDADYNFIDCELPHLEHLAVDINNNIWSAKYIDSNQQVDPHANEIIVEKMMRKNPHIRSVDLNNFSNDFVKNLEQTLPNIECLALDQKDEEIHFEHVKEFHQKWSVWLPTKIIFTNLQALRMLYIHNHFQEWQNFLRVNKNISRLEIEIESVDLPETQLETLTAELPNLTEMTVKDAFHLDAEIIIRLVKNNSNLKTFKYIFNETNEAVLRENLEHEWKIHVGKKGVFKIFTFQKRYLD